MKKINILNLITILSSLCLPNAVFAQWTQVGTLTAPNIWKRISVVDSNIVWACGGYGSQTNVWRTVNGGTNWTSINTNGLTQNLLSVLFAKDSLTAFLGEAGGPGFIAGNAPFFKTTNGGNNWILIDTTGGNEGWISGIAFAKTNPNFGFVISDPPDGPGEQYYSTKTTDGGATWNRSFIPGIYNTFTLGDGAFCVDSLFYGFLIINSSYTDSTRVYFTTNGGSNWNVRTTTPTFGTPYAGYCDFDSEGNNGIFVIAGMLPKIAKTTNAGFNWNVINIGITGTGNSIIRWVNGTNKAFLTAQSSSSLNFVFRSDDNGSTWHPQITPSNMGGIIDGSFFRSGSYIYGYVITSSGGVFKTRQDTMVIGIQPISNEIPSGFKLYQNYPNPFNPKSKIKFQISKISEAIIVVYDALGREVTKLVNEQLKHGTYEVEWDAANYPSGVYYYKLNAGEYIETRKMVLVK